METKCEYTAEVKNLIILCHIIDDFEEFDEKLRKVISPKYNRDFVFKLWDVSKGKKCIGATKVKEFYKENKIILDKMNEYSNIPTFINCNYDYYGNPNVNLKYFYEYISTRKRQIPKIISVLEKLEKIGIDHFRFGPNLDFTQEVYEIPTNLRGYYEYKFIYLNNLNIIPNYDSERIIYKTTDSNYQLKINFHSGEISTYGKEITLNNLIFDPETLPKSITKKETYEKLLALKEAKNKEYSIVKDSVNLSVGIEDLYKVFNQVNKKINELQTIEQKKELIEILEQIKEYILQMKTISNDYNKSVSIENEPNTEIFLQKEKDEYIRRREMSKIHWCW